jgi:hypothetical protein
MQRLALLLLALVTAVPAQANWCAKLLGVFSPTAPSFSESRRERIELALRAQWLLPWRHLGALLGDSEPQLYLLKDGLRAVAKQKTFYGARITNDPERELTAYGIDRFFRLGVVPPIVRRSWGTLQYYVEPAAAAGPQTDPVGLSRARFLRRMILREGDGTFETVVGRDGKLWAIDFGLDEAEPTEFVPTRAELLAALPDRATYEHLKTLTPADYRRQFGPYGGEIYSARMNRFIAVVEDEIRARGYAALFPR